MQCILFHQGHWWTEQTKAVSCCLTDGHFCFWIQLMMYVLYSDTNIFTKKTKTGLINAAKKLKRG